MGIVLRILAFLASSWGAIKFFFSRGGSLGGFFVGVWDKLKKLLEGVAGLGYWLSLLELLVKKILGIIGLGGALVSGGAIFAQISALLSNIGDPQGALLDYIHTVMLHLPYSMQSLLSNVDSILASATSRYFTPTITATYLIQVTGVGECFNQLLMSVIQNMVFIFSVLLVRWAFRQNFTFVKGKP